MYLFGILQYDGSLNAIVDTDCKQPQEVACIDDCGK